MGRCAVRSLSMTGIPLKCVCLGSKLLDSDRGG